MSHRISAPSVNLPGTKIKLVVQGIGIPESDISDVPHAFLAVWDRIPSIDRKVLCSAWKRANSSNGGDTVPIVIWDAGYNNGVVATTKSSNSIELNWCPFRLLPEQIRRDVIAHEMGHVFHDGKGLHRLNMTPDHLLRQFGSTLPNATSPYSLKTDSLKKTALRDQALEEIYANSMCENWGFSSVSCIEFFQLYYNRTDEEYLRRSRPRSARKARNDAITTKWSLRAWVDVEFSFKLRCMRPDIASQLSCSDAVTLQISDASLNHWEGVVICQGETPFFLKKNESEPKEWAPRAVMAIGQLLCENRQFGNLAAKYTGRELTIRWNN